MRFDGVDIWANRELAEVAKYPPGSPWESALPCPVRQTGAAHVSGDGNPSGAGDRAAQDCRVQT